MNEKFKKFQELHYGSAGSNSGKSSQLSGKQPTPGRAASVESKAKTNKEKFLQLHNSGGYSLTNNKEGNDDFISTFLRDSQNYIRESAETLNRMGWKEAADPGRLSTRAKVSENLRTRSARVRSFLEENKGDIAPERYDMLRSYLDDFDADAASISRSFDEGKAYYGQWKTEDDYNAYQNARKEYERKVNLDIGSADQEIRDLEKLYEEMSNFIKNDLQGMTFNPDAYDPVEVAAAKERYGQFSEQYGDLSKLEKLINEKKRYRNQAEYIQKGVALAGAAQNEDFKNYSGYISTESDGWLDRLTSKYGLGYQDLTYEYINNQDGIRDEIESKWAAYNTDSVTMGNRSEYAAKGYDLLTKDEVAIYNYYYAKEGRDKAQEYLDSIQETLNQRKASSIYAGMEGKTGLELIYGAEAGLDQFKTGMQNLFNGKDTYIAPSSAQMASAMVREDLADNGPKLPEWLGGASLGQAGYDAITTTANMAPSMLASVAANMIVPGSGAVVGTGLIGASAAGNAYQEALNEGYDKKSARAYSTLVGASEAGLQYLLGGISKLGGKVTGKALSKMLDGIDNAFARVALELGGNMISEGAEEGLQEILTPLFKSWTLKADEDVNWSEVAYSTLLGALTAGVTEGPGTVSNGIKIREKTRGLKLGEAFEDLQDDATTGNQTDAVAVDTADPEGLKLPSLENDTQAPGFVTQNDLNGTQTQVNDTALPASVPLSIADQLRQEQAQNGGTQYERIYERAEGSATAQPAGELYLPGGAGISDGSAERNAGAGTAEQAGVLAGSTRGRSAGQTAFASRAAIDRQSRAKNLRLEKVSSLDLGLQNGTEARNIQVMPQESWDTEMSQLADRIYNETGKGVTYVMGRIQIRGTGGNVGYVRGVITGDRIIVQADHLRIPMEQIADHEAYHAKAGFTDGRLNDEIRRHIVETFSEEQYRAVLETYVKQLRCVYNLTEAKTVEEYEETLNIIEEEIFADAYAGINAFSAGADQFTGAVNEKMDQLYMGKIRNQDNGTEAPTGPPVERFSADNTQEKEMDGLTLPSLDDAESSSDSRMDEMDTTNDPSPTREYVKEDVSQETVETGIRKVAHMDPVAQISGGEFAKGEKDLITQVTEFFTELDNRAYNPQLGSIALDRQGVRSDIAHGIGRKKAAAFAAVPDVLARGYVVDYQKNWKGRGYDTAVVAAPVQIGSEEYLMGIVLNRNPPENKFYVHEVMTTENGASPFKTGTRKGNPSGNTPSIFSILDRIRSVKNETVIQERFSMDDDATAMERELDRLKSPAYQDELARTGGSAALVRNQKQIESLEWRIRRDPETYERKKERELQTEGNTAAKVKAPSQRELEREREAWLKEEHNRKAQQQESRPLIAKRNLKKTVLDLFSVPSGQRAELGTVVENYADRLIKNGALTEDDRKAFFDRMYDAGVMVMPAEEYSAFARSHIVDGRIYVSDSVKSDFGDDWADIRRRAFAAGVYLVNDRSASGIDQWNATLSAEDMLPGLFDSEETDERTILERILQVAEEGKDEHLSLAEYTRRLSQQEGISEDEFLDNMERQLDWALRTFAEKARLEVHLRDRTGRKIAQEREKGAERMTRQQAKEAQRRADERQARKDSARRAKERRELRELQQRTLKQLQWLSKNRNRAPEELQATWDEVLGDIDLYAISAADEMRWSDKHNATWKDLAQMYKDAMKNDPNFLPSKELERIVTRLDATKIADMDLGALQDLYKAAIGLRTEFYNRNNVINDEMQRLFAEVYTDAKREIESAPGGFTGGVADKFLNLDQLTPMNVLQRMAGWDPDGAFYSMAKQLERGERDMRAYSVKAQKMLQDFLTEHEDWVKKADGQGKDAIWYEVEVPQLLELGMGDKPIFGPTVKVYMTPAQKVHMYLESKNLDNLRHMTGGRTFVNKDLYSQGKRQEALSQGRTIKLAPETVRKLVSDLTSEEMELAQLLDRYYNTFATQEINKVSNILYGYDKAMGKNYAPIYTNRNYTKTEFGVFDTTAEGVGNLKGRQYAVNPSYNISAFDAFERHVDQTARFCGMAIPARNWTNLMNWQEKNNSTGDVITHKWGEEGKRYITDLITTLQAGDDAKSDTISSVGSKLQSNYISAVFGFNPSIVMKQLGSIPMAGAYLDFRNLPKPSQLKSIDRELIGKYTQELEWRTMGYSMPETRQLKDNPTTAMDVLNKVTGKVTDKLKASQKTKQRVNRTIETIFNGGAITAMDGWAASTLWPWAENKVRREHPELAVGSKAQIDAGESAFYKKVAEEFEIAVSRSQSVSDEIHQGTLRKSKNPITKAFTMFRSDSAQTYNALHQKIGEAKFYARMGAPKKVKTEAKKAVGKVVCAMLINAMWAEGVSYLWAMVKNKGKYYRDDEDELTVESVIGEMGRNMVESIMGTVTFGDEIAQLIGNAITGDRRYDLEAPGLEQINEIFNLMHDILQGNFGRISEATDVVKNGGDLGKYLNDHSGEILGEIKDTATKVATYFGLSVNNVEAYLLGALKWISPELGAAYDDLFQSISKSDLAGMKGDALEGRVGRILSDRNVSESDDTAAALAALYEAGYKTAIPSDTPTSVSIDGEKHSLGDYQQQAYDTIWGGIVADALDDMVASDSFKEADPKTQAKMLSNLYTYAAEQAKAELFDEYELDPGAAKNAAIVAAGATVAECITWNTITSEMKSGEKSAELASWDVPEEAKREIFRSKISDSREDSIAAFDEAGLSFDQFLQAYSMYGQINNEDLKAGMKAVEFSHWVNAQGYTAEQAAVIKDELTYFNMTPASSSRYDELVGSGMDPDDAYDLTGALNELQPEDGEDKVSDLKKWRASVDFSDDVDDQLAALSMVMTDAQFQKVEIANDFGVRPETYVTLQEIKSQYDADGNNSYKNTEIQAAVDGLPGRYTRKQKAVLWQLATGSTSARNNPYSREIGQQVLDAKKAAKQAAAEEPKLEGLTLGNW